MTEPLPAPVLLSLGCFAALLLLPGSGGQAQARDPLRGIAPLPPADPAAPARCGAIDGSTLGPEQPLLEGRWRARLPEGMGPRAGTTPAAGTPWPGLWLIRGGTELSLTLAEEGIRPDASFPRFLDERFSYHRRAAGPAGAPMGTLRTARGRAVVLLPNGADPMNPALPSIALGYLLSEDGAAQLFDLRVSAATLSADREACRALALRVLATFVDGGRSPAIRGEALLALPSGELRVSLPRGDYLLGHSELPQIGRTFFLRRFAPRHWGQRRQPALSISRASPSRWSTEPGATRRRGALLGQEVEWIEERLDFGGGIRDFQARTAVTLGGVAYDLLIAGGNARERDAMRRALTQARFTPSASGQ